MLNVPILSSPGPRPLGLGELHNRMVAATDPEAAFVLWSDRIVPVDMQWDHAVAFAVMQHPLRMLWIDSHHLEGAGQPVIPPAWRAAYTGPLFPAVAPYWFDDTALEEIDIYVNAPPRVACWAKCAGPRTAKTNRCRDVAFWCDFFARTQPQRVAEAVVIRQKLGLAPRDMKDEISHFAQRIAQMAARAPELEAQYGAEGPPDDSYLAAKARAEKLLEGLST